MVERRLLTPEFVQSVMPPHQGERWIADSKLRGFGLRLWATPNGIGKAFGLRITDKNGKKVRKTFSLRYFDSGSDRELNTRLQEARRWAKDQIDASKGRTTLKQDQEERRQRIADRISKMTLLRAARLTLDGMRIQGMSAAYVDRLDKLFSAHIPKPLWSMRLNEVSPKAMACALARMAPSGGNLRILKSFIGQIFNRTTELGGSTTAFMSEFPDQFWRKWRSANKQPFPELLNLTRHDYSLIFARLEAEEERWQQALCIRLFFMLGAPLSRLMDAQWWQIIGDRWYPYLPEEKFYWFESSEYLRPDTIVVLERARILCKERSEKRYLFPSPTLPGKPITTTLGLWRDALEEVGSRYYPLAEFARHFRSPNNPTYVMHVLRQYGGLMRAEGNAAKVSKELHRRLKKL